jgi:addiction module HigA family antidote
VRELRNIHPGEVLKEEFLEPLHVSSHRLAQATGMCHAAVADIIQERGRITADAALRLAKFFGTTPRFWMGLQDDYDLEERQTAIADELEAIRSVG